jgi:hypothetical protein
MSGNFALFSTDISPTLEPWAATWDPQPDKVIRWDNDVDDADYQPPRLIKRGSVIPTGGGNVVQDMGIVKSDARIAASGSVEAGTWISTATAAAIRAAYEAGEEMFFTDGATVWRVKFLPGEENYPETTMSLSWRASNGVEVWAWSIVLMVVDGPLTPADPPEEVTP